ncbi:unnamed protein product [Meloidogyne enterolobii]|uniref:Uncharacterized protein n=1 Tax=Meloidogyne enterolobii TaxID=390850 RepID=A0ACB1AH67_MELEN
MSSQDGKIIEHEEEQWYWTIGTEWYQTLSTLSIAEDKVPDAVKNKKLEKINIPLEIQLDVLKCLDFNQLLSFQETSFYFKKFIDKYEKQLARKKYDKLEIIHSYQLDKQYRRHKDYKPYPELYCLKLDENVSLCDHDEPCENDGCCEFEGFCEWDYEFIKLEPQLYDFELSEQLEEKWMTGIENSIPMFLTINDDSAIDTIFCELQHDYKVDKALYYLQLSLFPKNLVEMKIIRYLLQLFFNCAFEYFQIDEYVINPQMIKLLFDEDKTTNLPLQLHSQRAKLFLETHHSLNFALNHLICNQFKVHIFDLYNHGDTIGFYSYFDLENNIDTLIKILTNEGNKLFNITYENLDSRIYNSIIKHIETSQDPSQMAKEIKFDRMYGSLISSENVENIKTKFKEGIKTTKFQLSNNHNPKIKFSVYIEDKYKHIDVSHFERDKKYVPGVRVVIKKIN